MPEAQTLTQLDQLQQWMQKAICEGTASAEEVNQTLTANSRLSAQERLNIYVRDFWGRTLDSLAEDFPELVSYWGKAKFEVLMEKYLLAHPSTSHTLRDLPQYLEKFITEEYQESDQALVLDYIRYEWAHIEASDAAETELFDPAKLSESQKNNLEQLPLQLQPHIKLLVLRYPVQKGLKNKLKPQKTYLVIYRKNFRTHHEKVSGVFFQILQSLNLGQSLQSACQNIPEQENENQIGEWFQNCVTLGWLQHPGSI